MPRRKKLSFMVLVAVALTATSASFSQSYLIAPNDTVSVSGVFDDLQTLSIIQTNLSADSLFLKWYKVSESVPAAWEASICDNSNCNTSLLDSGAMNPVIPGEYGLLFIHCTPKISPGIAIIRYCVYDINIPTQRDTLTYIIQVFPLSITEASSVNTAPQVYVNENKLEIKQLDIDYDFMQIFSLNGQLEYQKAIRSTQCVFIIDHLVRGQHIVKLHGTKNFYSQKIYY